MNDGRKAHIEGRKRYLTKGQRGIAGKNCRKDHEDRNHQKADTDCHRMSDGYRRIQSDIQFSVLKMCGEEFLCLIGYRNQTVDDHFYHCRKQHHDRSCLHRHIRNPLEIIAGYHAEQQSHDQSQIDWLSQHRANHLSDTVLSTLLFTFLTVLQIGNPVIYLIQQHEQRCTCRRKAVWNGDGINTDNFLCAMCHDICDLQSQNGMWDSCQDCQPVASGKELNKACCYSKIPEVVNVDIHCFGQL